MEYPGRSQKAFCCRYNLILLKSGVGKEIGPAAVLLLTCVVAHEDDNWYRSAPRFTDAELCEMLGFSPKSLQRHRADLVARGLLHYERGAKGKRSVYWVEGDKIVKRANRPHEPKPDTSEQLTSMRGQIDLESAREPVTTPILSQIDRESLGAAEVITSQIDRASAAFVVNLTANPVSHQLEEITLEDPKEPFTPASPSCSVPAAAPILAPGGPIDAPDVKTPAPAPVSPLAVPKRPGEPFPMFDTIKRMTASNSDSFISKVARKIVAAGITPEEFEDRFPHVLQKYQQGYRIKPGYIELTAVQSYWHWLRNPPSHKVGSNTAGSTPALDKSRKAIIDAAEAGDGDRPF